MRNLSFKVDKNNNNQEEKLNDLAEFNEEYRLIFAESILKKFVNEDKYCMPKLMVAINVSEKRIMSLDDAIESFGEVTDKHLCSEPEWAVLNTPKKDIKI